MENIKWFSSILKKKYTHMMDSCYNEKSKDYRFYGSKGITVCDDWIKNPQLFNDWAINNGYNNSLAVARTNINEGFSPNNCILTTASEAAKWKSTTTRITVGDITDSGKGWARRLNLGTNHINKYLKVNGMEKTVEYIKSILDGDFVFENKYKANGIVVDGIKDTSYGWDKRLGLSKGYINSFLKKNGLEKTVWYIQEKTKNPNFKVPRKRKMVKLKNKSNKKASQKIKKTTYRSFTKEDYSNVCINKLLQIKNCPRYFVTSDFHIYDSKTCKLLNEYQSNSGHLFVSIVKDNKRTTAWIHRIVYETYYGEVEDGYDIHHIDEDKTNNNINNLKKITHEEHGRIHSTKYSDKMMICPQCGKEFLWTAQKQQTFYSNQSRKRYQNSSTKPFCSKSCSGKYGKQVQETLCKENKVKHIDIDVFLNGKLVDTFDCIEKCSQLLQYEFDLNKYRANEYVKRVLSGERQQYKGYVFKYHN